MPDLKNNRMEITSCILIAIFFCAGYSISRRIALGKVQTEITRIEKLILQVDQDIDDLCKVASTTKRFTQYDELKKLRQQYESALNCLNILKNKI